VPCADDVMLNYQSTSFHDALAARKLFNLRPAPEFLKWLNEIRIYDGDEPRSLTSAARKQLVAGLDSAMNAAK